MPAFLSNFHPRRDITGFGAVSPRRSSEIYVFPDSGSPDAAESAANDLPVRICEESTSE